MRHFINILEDSEQGYTYLYRGDSTMIDKFDIDKTTEWFALFGYGIYLTSDPQVARDYTVKDDDNVVFSDRDEPYMSSSELIKGYIAKLANDAGFQQAQKTLLDKYARQMDKATYDEKGRYIKDEKNRKQAQDSINEEWLKARLDLIRSYVLIAKKEFKKLKPSFKMIKMTTGEFRLVKANRPAVISTFRVPNSYIDKVLHTERPLSDDMIELVRRAYQRTHPRFAADPTATLDLRTLKSKNDGDSEFETFDDYLDNYKKHGSRYAWSPDNRKIGGTGENPSLDAFMNGTHSGHSAFKATREIQTDLIKDCQSLGYVGFEYDGGTKITGSGTRGGGKNLHRAFVFWDDAAINSFRVENHPHTDDDLEMEKNLRWNQVPLK